MNISVLTRTEFEDAFRAIANANPHPVLLTGTDGVVVAANPAARALGIAEQARLTDLFGDRIELFLRRAARTAEGTFDRFELRAAAAGRDMRLHGGLVRPGGATGPALVSVTLTPMADAQRAFSALATQIDQLNAEIARRSTAERHLRAVIDTAFDGVLILDVDGRVRTFSPACERVFGVSAAAAQGRSVAEFIALALSPGRTARDALRGLARRENGVGAPRETFGIKADGETFPVEIDLEEVRRGDDTFLVAIVRDLTERKALESQLIEAQKMKVVGQLAGGVAHDFNNLLTVVLGNAELLLEALKGNPELSRLAMDVIAAGRRGAKLTSRLLSFGRRQRLTPRATDVNALIGSFTRLIRRALAPGSEIVVDLEPDLWPVMIDPVQLENAIINLGLNARDAMPSGGVLKIQTANISLSPRYAQSHPEVAPGDYIVIAVTDTGEGMPADVRERAFEPFFTTRGVGKGSGLGLSQTYGFVKQSRGHISIFSEPGLGATIRMYLPVAPELRPAAAEAAPPPPQEPTGPTVLIVESDPFVRSFAINCVTSMGYRALAAEDGRAALRLLKATPQIDLLFADALMSGGMNGWDLVRRARGVAPGIKALLSSGYALETLARAGYANGDLPVLNKPYRPADLQRRLAEALG